MKISTEEALEIIEEIQEEHELEAIAVLYEMDLIGNERMSYYYDDESMIFSMLEDKGAHYLVRLFVCVSEDVVPEIIRDHFLQWPFDKKVVGLFSPRCAFSALHPDAEELVIQSFEDAFVDSKIQGVGGGYLLMSREED